MSLSNPLHCAEIFPTGDGGEGEGGGGGGKKEDFLYLLQLLLWSILPFEANPNANVSIFSSCVYMTSVLSFSSALSTRVLCIRL